MTPAGTSRCPPAAPKARQNEPASWAPTSNQACQATRPLPGRRSGPQQDHGRREGGSRPTRPGGPGRSHENMEGTARQRQSTGDPPEPTARGRRRSGRRSPAQRGQTPSASPAPGASAGGSGASQGGCPGPGGGDDAHRRNATTSAGHGQRQRPDQHALHAPRSRTAPTTQPRPDLSLKSRPLCCGKGVRKAAGQPANQDRTAVRAVDSRREKSWSQTRSNTFTPAGSPTPTGATTPSPPDLPGQHTPTRPQ